MPRIATLRWRFASTFALLFGFVVSAWAMNSLIAQASGVDSVPVAAESNATIELEILVDGGNRYSGVLFIDLPEPPASSVLMYVVFPFRIADANSDSSGFYVSDGLIADDLSILYMLAARGGSAKYRVSFNVLPTMLDSAEVSPRDFGSLPSFLTVEQRGSTRFTLYFRPIAKESPTLIGGLPSVSDGMLVPGHIRFVFPAATDFYNIPPASRPSNVTDGTHPGRQLPNAAILETPIEFYSNDYLWVNYGLATTLPLAPGYVLHLTVVGLCPLGILVLAVPEEILSKKRRLIGSVASSMLCICLFVVNVVIGGIDYVVADLVLVIPAGLTFLLSIGLIILNGLPFLRQWLALRPGKRSASINRGT